MKNRELELVTQLANAAATGHTFAAIARRLTEALAASVPIVELTLARCAEPRARGAEIERIVCRVEGTDVSVSEDRVRLAGQAIRMVLGRSAPPLVMECDASSAARYRDVREARARGADRIVLLELTRGDEPMAASFATAASADVPRELLEDDVLASIAQVLSVAVRNATLIERVASLSRRAHRKNQQLRQQLQKLEGPERLVARSEVMRRVLTRVDLVARHPTTVLLLGESGTGKELLARRIHRLSDRAARPFLTINCGAIPVELVESELFGHEKGAFTGASATHAGLFQRADGGTILLDEVGELPLSAQVKLLRVLQEGEFERVGGEGTQRVDVRVIAATHRNLQDMVDAAAFRADLFYRLHVFPVQVPPLRERGDDFAGLVEALLATIGAKLGRRPPRPDGTALDRLRGWSWPGNVRELENLLEHAVILSPEERLVLPDGFGRGPGRPAVPPPSGTTAPRTLAEAMRVAIADALRSSGGKIYGADGAAAILDLKPTTLQSKMKKLGLEREHFLGDAASDEGL